MKFSIQTKGPVPTAQAQATVHMALSIINDLDALDVVELWFDRMYLVVYTQSHDDPQTELFTWNPGRRDWDAATGTLDTFPDWAQL